MWELFETLSYVFAIVVCLYLTFIAVAVILDP